MDHLPVIYIAGKYRDARGEWYVEQNIRAAEKEALFVWGIGGVALCPHKNTAFFGGACDDFVWLMGDLELLSRCDAVYAIDGYRESKGAVQEVEYAKNDNMPVFYSRDEVQAFIRQELV